MRLSVRCRRRFERVYKELAQIFHLRGRAMPDSASYRKLDFVDYFKALTETRDEWVDEFVGHPKCLAVLKAVVSNRVILGRALGYLVSEFPERAWIMEKALRQSARRYDLPEQDPRRIVVSADAKRIYAELLANVSARDAETDYWFSQGRTSELWSDILWDEQRQYVDYWKVANYEEYEGLLANRALLAKIDAFNRRLGEMEPENHVADIAEFAASQLPSLETSLRSLVLAHLSRDVRLGIVEIPPDLRADFPAIYAERGIV
jgi:hypothetical protein